jgi:hypothetical protein
LTVGFGLIFQPKHRITKWGSKHSHKAMTLAVGEERSEDAACHVSQVPRLKLNPIQAGNSPGSSDVRRSSLPQVLANSAREQQHEKLEIRRRGSQTARIRFAPPPRSKQQTTARFARPGRTHHAGPPSIFCELEEKRAATACSFKALEAWQQSMEPSVLKNLLAEVHDTLFGAIYRRPEEAAAIEVSPSASSSTSTLPGSTDDALTEEKAAFEYFSLVADVQEKVKLQQQEREQLTTRLAMETSLEQDLSAQLDQLERELTQLYMRHAFNRAEIEGERLAIEHLEKDYASLTEEEQELQRDCEVLELQLETQRAQLKEIRSQQLYLDFVSSAPLKRHMEEKKWQEQHASVAMQVQNAEAENRALEDEIRKLEDEATTLEAQYSRDVQIKQQAETTLSEIRVNYEQLQEAFERTRACYTPRPDWDRIVDETPELSVQKYQWEMLESSSAREIPPAGDEENDKDKVGVLEGLGNSTNNLMIKGGEENSNSKGRTKALVKEMLHWIERLQKHCGVNLHLSRVSFVIGTFVKTFF